jgi:hypothetical protein
VASELRVYWLFCVPALVMRRMCFSWRLESRAHMLPAWHVQVCDRFCPVWRERGHTSMPRRQIIQVLLGLLALRADGWMFLWKMFSSCA